MLSVSKVLALILAIIIQYIFRVATVFYFANIFFVFVLLFIALEFTIVNLNLCFKFGQHFYIQVSFSYCIYIVNKVKVSFGYFLHIFLLHHVDIELNPGPRNGQINKKLSCCHWNINTLLAYNFI